MAPAAQQRVELVAAAKAQHAGSRILGGDEVRAAAAALARVVGREMFQREGRRWSHGGK